MQQPFSTFIVDDEPAAREGVRALLERDADLLVTGEYGNGAAAAAAVAKQHPELLILDVEMPDLDGFQALDNIPESLRPVVVFLTAHEHYALRAFDVQAADYVLKPFRDERLALALARAKQRMHERRSAGGERFLTRVVARHANGTHVIDAREVVWIEGADYYARVHGPGQAHLIRESLDRLEAALDPGTFLRVHRSAIVNLHWVQHIDAGGDGACSVLLRTGARVPLSRRKRRIMESALRQLHQKS